MALTPWPNFAAATATDWAPLEALLHAMQERAAVARAYYYSGTSTGWAKGWISFGYEFDEFEGYKSATYDGKKAPALDVLKAIRDGIAALAGCFLNLDNRGASGFDAPQRWTGAELVALHPHLAILPERSAVEACAESLADYRAFLADAAAALERLRYVDARRHLSYTKNVSVDAGGTPAECVAALASPTVSTFSARRFPFARNTGPKFRFVRYYEKVESDAWNYNTSSWVHSVSERELVEASSAADVYIANPTPYAARAYLLGVPDYNFASRSERTVSSVVSRSNPEWVMFGARNTTYTEREVVARTWCVTDVESVDETQDDDVGARRSDTETTTTIWSDDATRSRSSTETETETGLRLDTTHPPEEHLHDYRYGALAYSGFAWPCASPNPVCVGKLAAGIQRNVLEAPAQMPAPTTWEDLAVESKSPSGSPRNCTSEMRRSIREADVFAFLDFAISYTYGGVEDEEDGEEE